MTNHDQTARRIAKRLGGEYNQGQGPDIITPSSVVEVETPQTLGDAARQLAGFRRSVYVAGADAATTRKALERFGDSTIGVMDQNGKVVKRSKRKKK